MNAPLPFLPYGRQFIDDDDVAAVVATLRGDHLTTGPAVERFERVLCEAVGARHAVACANGTAALHLAALALDLRPGDRVVVPTVTFLATANAARYVGAEVVFADVDPETGLMGPRQFEEALRRSDGPVRAVFPVHLNGQPVDLAAIAAIAAPRGVAVVDDACHALGGVDADGTPVGGTPVSGRRDAVMSAFSFHPVKTVAMGEGGAVTTDDDDLAARMRVARHHGMIRTPADFTRRDMAFDPAGEVNPWYSELRELGFNFRASDIACALGASQLAKLADFSARRRALAARYDALLAPLAPSLRPVGRRPGVVPTLHLYAVLIDFERLGLGRGAVMRALRDLGVGTQVHYIPVHHQPYYRERYGVIDLPGADEYYRRCLSIPLFVGMSDADVDRVVDGLGTIISSGASSR